MRRVKKGLSVILILTVLGACMGCASNSEGKKEEPVTVTLWHVYGGQTESPLNDLIDEFNQTVGEEENICVSVGSVTNTNTIHESVLSSAFEEPGASKLPDMFVSYPKTVLAMPDEDILVDYRDYFTKEELEEFIPEFMEEGFLHDRQVILPVAKSTETMFVNKTAFERFSDISGIGYENLVSWDGLYEASEEYARRTGKTFFVHDYHFNYFQVGVDSLGEDFFDEKSLVFGPAFERVWKPYAHAALSGGVWLQEGYATEPLRTGDTIVSVASSASVLYYSDEVTYEDNTSEKVEIITMPCPVFEEGSRLVMQRGAGICTVKSSPEREEACMTFLKWLTDAKRNVEFVTSLGYMPVKQESFDRYLPEAIHNLQDPMYVSLYKTLMEMQKTYKFYTMPQLDTYLDLETRFEKLVRQILLTGRNKVTEEGWTPDEMSEITFQELKSAYSK